MSSSTLYGCIIFLRRECPSVCLFVGFSQDLSNGRAEQTSRFFRIYMSQQACFDSLERLFRRRVKRLMLEFS